MTSAASQCYVEYKGQYQPINIVPAGAKCIICQQNFHPDALQAHLLTHVNPSYQKPVTSVSKP